jgi:hypothetical protein
LERIVEFDLVVVAGALVVGGAVVLVLEAVPALGLVLDVVGAEVVVVAETPAKDAEYAEHLAKPTDSAATTSDALQAVTRQGAAYSPRMGIFAELHWQPSSVRAHPADEMADTRHGIWMSTVRIQSTYSSRSIELWEERGQDGRACCCVTWKGERPTAQDGSPAKFCLRYICAFTKPPAAASTTEKIAPFILTRFQIIYTCLMIG